MMDHTQPLHLPNGYVIVDPFRKLITKYIGSPNTLMFDFYAAAQLERRRTDEITLGDALVTSTMNSNMSAEAVLRCIGRLPPLEHIPPHAGPKDDVVSGRTHEAAEILRESLGVANATSHAWVFKLLAVKRPFLIPMLDQKVGEALRGWPGWPSLITQEPPNGPQNGAADGRWLTEGFWALLRHEQVERRLVVLRDALATLLREALDLDPPLPLVRLLDSLLWFEGTYEGGATGAFQGWGWTWPGGKESVILPPGRERIWEERRHKALNDARAWRKALNRIAAEARKD